MVLTKFKLNSCLLYMDDVLIYSNDVEEHIKHEDEILKALI